MHHGTDPLLTRFVEIWRELRLTVGVDTDLLCEEGIVAPERDVLTRRVWWKHASGFRIDPKDNQRR